MSTRDASVSKIGGTSFPRARFLSPVLHRCQGFKLIEFVAVLAIASTVGITAVSAYGPSSDSKKGRHAAAQAAMAEIAVLQEEYFLNNRRYIEQLGSEGLGLESAETPDGHYALRVEMPADACPRGFCYIISAKARDARAGDECGMLTLTSDGTKLPKQCW